MIMVLVRRVLLWQRGLIQLAIQVNMEALITWGKFVSVAYTMYAQDPVSPAPPLDLPEGWEWVANLSMTPRLESWRKSLQVT
jgi:hypothetical protein